MAGNRAFGGARFGAGLACLVLTLALLGAAGPAGASGGGLIAFGSDRDNADWDVWVMNADGSGATNLTHRAGFDSLPAWSPDGSKIAFVRDSSIAVMNADGSNVSTVIPTGTFPAWSPDGSKIAYSDFNGIAVANADGSNPKQLTTEGLDYRPSWSPDGTLIAFDRWVSFANQTRAVFVMHADGSNVTQLTPDTVDSTTARFSPDGMKIAFRRALTCCNGTGAIDLIDSDGSGLEGLTPLGSYDDYPSWSADGKTIVFQRSSGTSSEGDLYRIGADGAGLTQLTSSPYGEEVPAVQPAPADTTPPTATATLDLVAPAASAGGALFRVDVLCWDAVGVEAQSAAVNGIPVVDGQLLSLKTAGGPQRTKTLRDGTLQIAAPAFKLRLGCTDAAGNTGSATAVPTPLGKIAFLSNRSGSREIYTINRDGSGVQRLTFNDIFERAPVWSPDGTKLAFAGLANGNWDVYTLNADGTGLRRLTTNPARDDYPAWTPDGRSIVYSTGLFDCPCTLRLVGADGSNDRALPVGPGNSFGADVSHDGTIAFANDRTGQYAIYTVPLAGGTALPVSAGSVGGDFQPRWSPDGRTIAFLRDVGANDNDLWLVGATGAGLRQLTSTPDRAEFSATWSPEGRELVVYTGQGVLYAIRADGSGETRLATGLQSPFAETFDRDGVVDPSRFHTINDSGGSILAVNGRLEASIAHDADPSIHNFDQVDEHIGTQCTLNGDFDVQVDYSLDTWPAHNGFFAMLNGIFADGAIARTSMQWDPPSDEQYNAWTNGPTFTSDQLNTTDRAGEFRLVRSAGKLYEYERASPDAQWTLVHVGPATGNTVAAIGLWAPGSSFAHLDGKVAFDNWRFNSGGFTCPDWWSDSWPDWQRLPDLG